jgi:hypothetical protein
MSNWIRIIPTIILGAFAMVAPAAENEPASCPALTHIRFYPRKGEAAKMLKGKFTASNEGATTGFETMAEIKQAPPEGEWTEINLAKPVRYRFLKYEAPNNSWGNVAEIEFYSGTEKIKGRPFGTTGSRNNSGNDFSKALDGNVETYFDGAEPNNQYVGLDLGEAAQTAQADFLPKPGSYPDAQQLSLTSATPGAKIRIVRGGGTPGPASGEEYKGPLAVDKSAIIAAIAYTENLAPSPVVVGAFRIGQAATNMQLVRSYHTGNSLTDTVDGWLRPIAESGGHPLDFHRFTVPGAPTDWLWTHPGSGFGDTRFEQALFAYAPFDHLVIQPFAGHGRSVENETLYGGNFYELCLKSSPGAKLWLYQQWPETKFGEGWSKGTFPLGKDKAAWEKKVALGPDETLTDGGWQGIVMKKKNSPVSWQEAVAYHSRYFEILREEMQRRFPGKPIGIIPGGQALATLKEMMEAGKVPGLTDFFKECFSDGIHLTGKGRYLIGLVHYGCFFGESPEGKVSPLNSGLTEEQTKILQKIAWETVKNHPWAGVAK